MVFKTPDNFTPRSKGLTIVELTLVVFVVVLLFSLVIVLMNPLEYRKKARDNKRISDMATLDRIISEYRIDKGSYPDSSDTLRTSTILPSVQSVSLYSAVAGWIDEDLSAYVSKLPTDPINDDTYFYSFIHSNDMYEIRARLESLVDLAQNDGGDDSEFYELGNNLSLL